MATILQLRRGTTVQHSSFTGAVGEVTVDTTKDTVVVHDGTTAGGFALAKESALSGFISLTALSGGTGLDYNNTTGVFDIDSTVATKTYVDTAVQGKDNTDEITEGSTNLYFTNARARGAVSVTDSGGDGSLAYNSTTGVITYTGPSASDVRAHFSEGTGVTITNGQVAIGQAVGTSSNVTFNDVTVSGNLTVSGTTTTVNTETINLADNIITLNSNEAGAPSQNAGIEVERGTSTNVAFQWNETTDVWEYTVDGTNYIPVVGTTATQTLTNKTISGSSNTLSNIANSSLTNSKVTIGSTDVSLGATVTTFAGLTSVTATSFVGALTGNASTVTNGVYTTDTGTVTNTMLAGSIANAKLVNSAITLAGTSVSLGGAFTAQNMLDAIKTVDGLGSGLDADVLDGQTGSYYRINIYDAAGTLLN